MIASPVETGKFLAYLVFWQYRSLISWFLVDSTKLWEVPGWSGLFLRGCGRKQSLHILRCCCGPKISITESLYTELCCGIGTQDLQNTSSSAQFSNKMLNKWLTGSFS
jgi:hypothetical protein